jgi:hypothetical protein
LRELGEKFDRALRAEAPQIAPEVPRKRLSVMACGKSDHI